MLLLLFSPDKGLSTVPPSSAANWEAYKHHLEDMRDRLKGQNRRIQSRPQIRNLNVGHRSFYFYPRLVGISWMYLNSWLEGVVLKR